MKRLINISILLIFFIFVYFALTIDFKYGCLFKHLFNIRCPGCGLTRSIQALLRLDIKSSIYYNVLGIPLFILTIILVISFILDIVRNKNNTLKYLNKFLSKYYIVIILILLAVMIINNVHKI